MDIEKIKEEIHSIVQEILAEQAAAGIESKVEEALKLAEDTVVSLTDTVQSLEKKAVDDAAVLESLEAEKVSVETEMASKVDEVSVLKSELKELKTEAASVKDELDNLRKDMLSKDRMASLEELKIARKGEALEKQVAAVREMTDEEFAGYSDEMVALREEILASVQASVDADDTGTDTEPSGEVAGQDSDVTTPPADVEGARETASILPSSDTDSDKEKKWDRFGNGLATLMKGDRENNK